MLIRNWVKYTNSARRCLFFFSSLLCCHSDDYRQGLTVNHGLEKDRPGRCMVILVTILIADFDKLPSTSCIHPSMSTSAIMKSTKSSAYAWPLPRHNHFTHRHSLSMVTFNASEHIIVCAWRAPRLRQKRHRVHRNSKVVECNSRQWSQEWKRRKARLLHQTVAVLNGCGLRIS